MCLLFPQISSYSLVVRATDNGTPPLSSETIVNLQVLDVNDNPPTLFQFNYSVVIQVGVNVPWMQLQRKKYIIA